MNRSAYGLDTPRALDWREQAACRDLDDKDLMFPVIKDALGVAQARAVCAGCPVTTQCLADAARLHDYEGVRGGLTGPERYRAARPSRATCPDCGAFTWQGPDGALVPHRVPGSARSHPRCQPATSPATTPIGAS